VTVAREVRAVALLFVASCASSHAALVELRPMTLPAPPSASTVAPAPIDAVAPPSPSGGLAFDSINARGRVEVGGHVAIVDFWASWCAPCKRAFPKLQALYDRHRGEGLVVIGLAMDDDIAEPLEFVKAIGTTFPVALDIDHERSQEWNLKVMPSTMVLDRSGAVRYRHDGYHDGQEVDLEREVSELLAAR
jgi:thiol-disulfide isomerase/thioredoxin